MILFTVAALLVIVTLAPIAAFIVLLHLYLATGWPPLAQWVNDFRQRMEEEDQ